MGTASRWHHHVANLPSLKTDEKHTPDLMFNIRLGAAANYNATIMKATTDHDNWEVIWRLIS